ncbi:DUF234 domain-containing protein [Dorea formicigenerans]|nr:DUF234 domain-containing protein [Dorea formicigenerans]MCB6384744.1 DUF234 domain-containing protein [Dorea formicigenerans]MCB6392783.1 DUF234 domain-containing protein [Dorea formicigenerans]MCB6395918.1 DUF234 domain-containing protein [Dorea formicigenerans]MCB6398823.1 DUF234 domain-containing protein [Dorea formicigenerans]
MRRLIEKFVAFAYEDICKDIFASVCKQEEIPFVPSRIGSYWLNDYDSNTEIDIMAIDNQNKRCMFPKGREKTEVI